MKKNIQLETLIKELKRLSIEEGVKVWKRVASDLEKPSRNRRTVNLFVIEKYAREGETVVVPGKVLSEGELTKPVTVAAYSFSESAKKKIEQKGKAIMINELIKNNPKGQKVRILG